MQMQPGGAWAVLILSRAPDGSWLVEMQDRPDGPNSAPAISGAVGPFPDAAALAAGLAEYLTRFDATPAPACPSP